ncbi:MAG TPA: 30S ribosomal protein S20 [Patescibacteria group bacterium]|nr:30S ribosomal protein S20 [Patescibacteria group bacterium]
MPIIKSAKKRVRIAKKASILNSKTKRSLKSSLKVLATDATIKNLNQANSQIDKALKKGVIHKNKAARLKSRVSILVKANKVQAKKTVKKAPAKAKTTAKSTKKK